MDPDAEDVLRRFRHDVRSPLNVVLGFAVMLEEELDGEQAESALHIRRAAEELLSLVEGLEDEGAPAPVAQEVTGEGADGLSAGDVVLVEDNASNVRLVERILAHRPGRRLAALTDVAEVERWLASEDLSPVLVLLDRHLGRTDGLDLIAPVRARHPEVRIVVVTADATEVAREEAMAAGADDVVTKPFSVAGLLQVVDRSSGERPPGEEPPGEEPPADQSSAPTAGSKR